LLGVPAIVACGSLYFRSSALVGDISHDLQSPDRTLALANGLTGVLGAFAGRNLDHQGVHRIFLIGGSAGTHPSQRVHSGAVAAAKRRGLDLSGRRPKQLGAVKRVPRLVITVCDRAHEELEPGPSWLLWSVPDPVPAGDRAAFDSARDELEQRILALIAGGAAA